MGALALPEEVLWNLPILRDGLTLPSRCAQPAGLEALAFGKLSRFLPGACGMSTAADRLGGLGQEAELVLYTLPWNPYDPPRSAVPLSFGQEKLSGHFELANLTVTILGRTAGR